MSASCKSSCRLLFICGMILALASLAQATSIAEVKVEDLYKQADLVAVVKIVSADSEHYAAAVYKAEVIQAFKGASAKKTIFFGPFIGARLGSEYVVFARKSEALKPNGVITDGFGVLPDYYGVMYEGYGLLEISYECVFEGKQISEECDYAVRLNPDQVILPKNLKASPPESSNPACESVIGDVTNHHRWVRKKQFLSLLARISNVQQ